MRLSISSTNVKEWSGDVLVVGLPKGDPSTYGGEPRESLPRREQRPQPAGLRRQNWPKAGAPSLSQWQPTAARADRSWRC
jgi:hypothetical protein